MLTLPTQQPTQQEMDDLRRAAEAASPGPWKGDRFDGTVKYALLAADGTPVINGDNGNSNCGPFGIVNEEDERYLKAAHPTAILALLALIDAQNKRIAELVEDNKELHI